MPGYIYETHMIEDSLLPFIFHRETTVAQDHTAFVNWHENIEILCCVSGRGSVQCNSNIHDLEAGDIFVVNSEAVHSTFSEGVFIYHCLIVDKSFFLDNGIPVSELQFQELIRDPALYLAFFRVADAFSRENREVWDTAWIRHEVLGLLISLCRKYARRTSPETTSAVPVERVKKAMTYIRNNLSKQLTLDEIADHVGISKYHFAREFKAFTGETVIDSINILRCKEAKRLIESGMSVSAAAMSCGFENLSYFSRTFKKHFGQLPSSFLVR